MNPCVCAGVSDQEDAPPAPRVKSHMTKSSPLSNGMIKPPHVTSDPVSNILDRIDAELEAMNQREVSQSKHMIKDFFYFFFYFIICFIYKYHVELENKNCLEHDFAKI